MSKVTTLKKPLLTPEAVLDFAEARGKSEGQTKGRGRKTAPATSGEAKSGLVPSGDVRLTANIREDLHLKLKIRAAKERTTVGELIERLVEEHLQ